MTAPTLSQIERVKSAIIGKAVRFLLLPEAPFGAFGEPTEFGTQMVKPDYAIKEVLYGMVGLDIEASTDHTVAIHVGSASDGTFTLTYAAEETAAIDWDATKAAVKLAFEALSTVTYVVVTGTGQEDDPWVINFGADDSITAITADDALLDGGEIDIEVLTVGVDNLVAVTTDEVITNGLNMTVADFPAAKVDDVTRAITVATDWVYEYLRGGIGIA